MPEIESKFVDYDLYSSFYSLVRQIPEGMVSTYGALARALGDVVAARACGYMLSINPDPVGTPCYKVVRAGGEVGKFTHPDGEREKVRRLNRDGVEILGDKISDFASRFFDSYDSDHPLASMKEEQEKMASKVVKYDDFVEGDVAAVDVSYDDDLGYAAMVIDRKGELEVRKIVLPVRFPYIPGYLSYREFKFIKELTSDFRGILLIDGNGYLHPRRIGLASFTGVMLDLPTIGVAKSILTGNVDGKWIYSKDERSAYIMNKKTIVSLGHRVTLDSAVGFLKSRYGERYPELLRIAHNETVKLRKESKTEVDKAKVVC